MLSWFTGNDTYHNLFHCMTGDMPWIILLLLADLTVVFVYLLIAVHAYKKYQENKGNLYSTAFRDFMLVFLFCAICGYAFDWLKTVYPAYRLKAILNFILALFSLRFYMQAKTLDLFNRWLGNGRKNN